MRVVYIVDHFPKLSETFVVNEILAMQRKGLEVIVYALSPSRDGLEHPMVRQIKTLIYAAQRSPWQMMKAHGQWLRGKPIAYLKTLFFSMWPAMGIAKRFVVNLADATVISQLGPDHIHAHFGRKAADLAMLVRFVAGIEFSFTTHRYDIFDLPPRNYRWKSRLAKKHVTVSEYNKKVLQQDFGVRARDVTVIHCGIDCSQFRVERSGASGTKIILSVGRLERQKGFDILVRACEELRKRGEEFRCLVVGEGSERDALVELIFELELQDRVLLLGQKAQPEIVNLLRTACIFVLPSRCEGIPVSLMEAMSAKVPVIATAITGIPELIKDGEEGFLVPPDDVAGLTERMAFLLKSEEARTLLVERAYMKVLREFDLKRETDKLVGVWREKRRRPYFNRFLQVQDNP